MLADYSGTIPYPKAQGTWWKKGQNERRSRRMRMNVLRTHGSYRHELTAYAHPHKINPIIFVNIPAGSTNNWTQRVKKGRKKRRERRSRRQRRGGIGRKGYDMKVER